MGINKIICHINNMSRGGAERVMSVLINSMVEDGIDVVLVTLDHAANEYELPDIKRVAIDENQNYKNKIDRIAKRHLSLRKIIKQEKPDLVLSFTVKENFRAVVSMLGINIPLLVSVRNDPKVSYKGNKILTKLMERKAAGCVFQTTEAKDFFSKRLGEKSCVIINPLDDRYLENSQKHQEYLDNKLVDNIVICNVARISEQKNQMMLIKAFEKIHQNVNTTLKIYGGDFGDGTQKKLEDYIAEHGLKECVLVMGVCSNIEHELANSDIFVLSSNYEGMPNALMEAMATGMAVISTDCPCGGPREIIEDGINGKLVPVNDIDKMSDALKELIVDVDLRKKIGDEASKICDKANKDAVYSQWKDYILKINSI